MSRSTPRVTRIDEGTYRVEIDGRAAVVYVAGAAGRRTAWWNGQLFEERPDVAAPRSGSRRTGPQVLAAPMPATVIRVLASPGDRVSRGQTVVLLEAMKMEWPLKATDDAVVAKVNCREGELVQPDAPLVELTMS